MKKLSIISILLFAGCTVFQASDSLKEVYSDDITGDDIPEIVTIVESDIELADDFIDIYPYIFDELSIKSEDRILLTIDSDGVVVEDGESISAQITTQAAYAMQLGEEDFMYVVQLDETGTPVSEPLTINWDISTAGWEMN